METMKKLIELADRKFNTQKDVVDYLKDYIFKIYNNIDTIEDPTILVHSINLIRYVIETDFLVNDVRSLTKQECIDLQNILSNCSNAVNKKVQTLKKQIDNIILKIDNNTIIEESEDYKKFKQAAPAELSNNEVLNMYLKYKGKL